MGTVSSPLRPRIVQAKRLVEVGPARTVPELRRVGADHLAREPVGARQIARQTRGEEAELEGSRVAARGCAAIGGLEQLCRFAIASRGERLHAAEMERPRLA